MAFSAKKNNEKNDKKVGSELVEIIKDFSCNMDGFATWVSENRIRTMAVQLPEGLKRQAYNIIQYFQSNYDLTVIFLADPCYGACDIPASRIEKMGIDGILHFGHSKIPNISQQLSCGLPVFYTELISRTNPAELLMHPKNINTLKQEFFPPIKIGLVANLQYLPYLTTIKSELEKLHYQVLIGAGDERITYHGQILGCNFSAAKAVLADVVGFLFIGDGIFHPMGIALASSKTVLAFDPITNTIQKTGPLKERILRQRNGAIARGKTCTDFGILVSIKPGQNRMDYAKDLRTKLSKHNKHGTIVIMDNISQKVLDYLPFEGYINTACPRLTIDDYLLYKKPILTPIELEIILGERSWDDYIFDEIW